MSVRTKLASLLASANGALGENNADLTAAVRSLIAGLGEGIQGGAFIPVNSTSSYTVSVTGSPQNAVCFLQTPLTGTPGFRWIWLCAQSALLSTGYRGTTSSNGSSMSGAASESACAFGEGTVTFDGGSGVFVGGETYVWIAY